MNTDMAALQERLGTEAPPIQYVIDDGSIKYFADSIMDPDPRYRSPRRGRDGEPHGMVAPPTFFGGATGLRGVPAGHPDTMSALHLPFPSGWLTIATGDEFEFFQPVLSGMTLVSRERFVDVREKLGRSGRLIFYTIEKLFSTPAGEPVVRRVLYCAAREPNPVAGKELRDSQVTVAPDVSIPGLTVGPVTVRHLAMFATATAEFVDIHYDADFARSVGLPGPIIQGLYKTALVARMLKDWSGDGSLIRSLKVEHRRMDLAGTVLTVGGSAMENTPTASRDMECSIWVRNQDGLVTTSGSARIARSGFSARELSPAASTIDKSKEHHQE